MISKYVVINIFYIYYRFTNRSHCIDQQIFFRLPKFKAEIKCFLSQWIPSCLGDCLLEMKNSSRCPDCIHHLIPSEFISKETNSISRERIRRGYYRRGESNQSSNLDFKTFGNEGANLCPATAVMDKTSGNPKSFLNTHCNQNRFTTW